MSDRIPNGPEEEPDAEGVRLIGPDEAAEAMEREDVVPRLSEREPRFGDRPPPPEGPRPALRFPLSPSEPPAGDRPPVTPQPIDEPPATHTAELPHWTDPPTGEVPRVVASEPLDDDLDAWSSFASSAPRWRDQHSDWDAADYDDIEAFGGDDTRLGALDEGRPSHEELFSFSDVGAEEEQFDEPEPVFQFPSHSAAEPAAASTAGQGDPYTTAFDDPYDEGFESSEPAEPEPVVRRRPQRHRPVGGQPARGSGAGRDVPTAVAVGVGFAAVALILFALGAKFAALLVFVVLALAAAELFGAVRRAGSQPVVLVGLVATAAFPLAVYWKGLYAFPLVLALAFGACVLWYLLGAAGDAPVLEGLGVTLLGVVWIGVLGSFATLMLRAPDGRGMVLAAVIVTIAYDVGGFAVGRSFGSKPLSAASPNKTVEGLIGGMGAALLFGIIIGAFGLGAFHGLRAGFELGVFAAVAAPIGDLAESLLKRDLGIKDMGSLLPGHGGMLDRIDAMLFVMPAAYFVIAALIR
jgi:phosphatidate cytidylyltransferase